MLRVKETYDKTYFSGGPERPGSDVCRKYDMHWWAFRYYARLAQKYCRAGTVLELGCAHGFLLGFFPRDKYELIGKDLSGYALSIARKNNPGAVLYQGSVEQLAEIASASVDVVVAKYVLEHVAHPEKTIGECSRVLKPGGTMIFAVPNTSSLLRGAKGVQWIGSRDETHCSVLTPGEWMSILAANGFTTEKAFSDGFWDVPYMKFVPGFLQLAILGWPTILQTLFVGRWIPIRLGENLIVVARRRASATL